MGYRLKIAVLFDKDGVLMDTHEAHLSAYLRVYHEIYGITDGLEIVGSMRGRTLRESIKDWNQALDRPDISYDEYYYYLCQFIKSPECDQMLFGQGISHDLCSFLDHLARLKIPRAVVTSNHRHEVKRRFDRLNFWHWFEDKFVITHCDTKDIYPPKPHPGQLLLAAQQLGLPPKHCAMIGDSSTDIDAAHAAGMVAIGFTAYLPPSKWSQVGHADLVINSFDELSVPIIYKEIRKHRLST